MSLKIEVPKFLKCPECEEKYSTKKNRRVIDSCGHPRCFSCLVKDNDCTICKTILSRRRSSRSSLNSINDENVDSVNINRGSFNESFSKEHYIRRLYSYPISSDQNCRNRQRSLDSCIKRPTYNEDDELSYDKNQELPHGRQRARTLSREKIHEEIPQYHRLLSDTSVNTFTGMFRKDSYLRTLYSYDPNSKGYNMEEKMRKYRSLEILNDRARAGSFSSDVSSEAYISTVNCSTPDQRSLCSSIDELNEDNTKSSSDSTPHSAGDSVKRPSCPKTWPSCPDLTHYENIWQMRQSTIERRKRPSSLYQMKYSSCNSPRSSGVYSPRSSGYWSELEQLSESETLSPSPSPLSQDTDKDDISITEKSQESEINESDINLKGAWQITRGVLQKWRFQSNRPQSECLTNNRNCSKPIQRINSVNIEQHTKKVSENNTARKAFMTDV